MKIIAKNKKGIFDYEILEKYEAGIELLGLEVKSIRNGRISMVGSFVIIKNAQAYLLNTSIPPYQTGNTPKDYKPSRTRKLLLHESEIKRLLGKIKEKGLTLVPIQVYNKRGKIKLEIGLARHRRKVDKREKIKKREIQREIEREFKKKKYGEDMSK
jgi:SsrA-binding protein